MSALRRTFENLIVLLQYHMIANENDLFLNPYEEIKSIFGTNFHAKEGKGKFIEMSS